MSSPPVAAVDWEYDLVASRSWQGPRAGEKEMRLPLPDGSQQILTFTTADAAQSFCRELMLATMELRLLARPELMGSTEPSQLARAFGLPGPPLSTFRDVDPPAADALPAPVPPYVHDGREVDVTRICALTSSAGSPNQIEVRLTDGEVVTLTYGSAEERKAASQQLGRQMIAGSAAVDRVRLPRQRLWRPSQPETIVSVARTVQPPGPMVAHLRRCGTKGSCPLPSVS